MSVKFDPKTGNLLVSSFQGNVLKFISITGESYDATEEDTLIYSEDINDTSLTQYENFFKNMIYDHTNPKEIKECPECKKNELVVTIRIRDDLINKCLSCKKQWIEGMN